MPTALPLVVFHALLILSLAGVIIWLLDREKR